MKSTHQIGIVENLHSEPGYLMEDLGYLFKEEVKIICKPSIQYLIKWMASSRQAEQMIKRGESQKKRRIREYGQENSTETNKGD